MSCEKWNAFAFDLSFCYCKTICRCTSQTKMKFKWKYFCSFIAHSTDDEKELSEKKKHTTKLTEQGSSLL